MSIEQVMVAILLFLLAQEAFDKKSIFVKVHAPWKTLSREAEALSLKMPREVKSLSVKIEDLLVFYFVCLPPCLTDRQTDRQAQIIFFIKILLVHMLGF